MLAPETILQSRYRITHRLGQGGMGTVYEAIDQRLRSTIALKETLFTDERLRKQFEREAELLAGLHHPALPHVMDHFTEGDGQFLVMQFIRGEDLSEMLERRGGPFPVEDVLRWGDQLLDALDYLHTQEPPVIHRDIKPQNLKVTARGQIILLDFGLAKGFAGQMSRVTTSGSIFGFTPNYAPLEQIQGTGTDARSDLYSLAATLYHLMTNVVPPDVLTRIADVANGMPEPLRPAHKANPDVTPEVSTVLGKALSIGMTHRPASAAEMRQMLKDASMAQTPVVKDLRVTELLPPNVISTSAPGHTEPSPTIAAPAAARPTAPPPVPSFEPAPAPPAQPARTVTYSRANLGLIIAGVALLIVLIVLIMSFSVMDDSNNSNAGNANYATTNSSNTAVTVTNTTTNAAIVTNSNARAANTRTGNSSSSSSSDNLFLTSNTTRTSNTGMSNARSANTSSSNYPYPSNTTRSSNTSRNTSGNRSGNYPY